MIFATDYFNYIPNELPEFNLKLLLNIEDLNNSIFNEVFTILKPHQQEEYITFKESEEAKKYRKERNTQLPYVDFSNLPEIFDDVLLQKVILYQKEGEIGGAIYDSLSEDHKGQIARFNSKIFEEEKAKRRALLSDEEKRKEKEWWDKYEADPTPRFMGNMGEPANADEYVLRYGRNPFTGKPETIESFYEKYTITETGEIVPKEKDE
ncbi:hypothetical protein [Chryseobacterium jejuense]|uniref:Uncharacterized protein n=1 Tax=Chryseobacterium jejuense TaxID=445960 RepID=A0A2X2VH04_CHRJE|nr:hypothetical protein [Chryseobacterium jejuense]SDJ09184.1 hypothetical protein SAMN05421542_2611 [Chryseobacterium jejuense]SQB27848.1 Uncharacterised protein [Chryseobacterium jejuense]